MASPLTEQLGCAFEDGTLDKIIRVDNRQQTSIVGVYAAGDAANVLHNATLALASRIMAGVHVHRTLVSEDSAQK